MRFEFTPDEARAIAEPVAVWLRDGGFRVSPEKALGDAAPYRTTLLACKGALTVLVEAQGALSYGERIRKLCHWLAAQRAYCEFYIATRHDAAVTPQSIAELRKDGVGLVVPAVGGGICVLHMPRNWALVVTPDPNLTYGSYRRDVAKVVETFNDGDRKDALRDMCELVETLTDTVARTAARKGYVQMGEAAISRLNWNRQIDALSAPSQAGTGSGPVLAHLQTDLHSFRGARNLVDHKVRSQREKARRERQFTDRMVMGPRLVAELVSVLNRIRRGR